MPADNKDKVTVLKLRKQKENNVKTVGVTAYDYPQALMADNAGVDWVLVGDSLGMTTLGYKTTIPVTMDDMLRSARAVSRGVNRAFTVGDMPYMSYQISNEEAVRNAGDFIKAGMDAVKVEGCMVERIKAICDSGIMVMSHLGLTPHTRAKLGGYRVQGKTADQAQEILDQALSLQEAGCSFLLLEAMPREAAALIADTLEIPVYDDHPTPNGAGWFYLKVKEFPVPFRLWGDDENHIKTLCKQKGYAHLEWMKRDFPPFL